MQGVAAFLAASALACSKIPPGRSAIDSVDVSSVSDLGGGEVADRLATAETPKFLGLFRGIAYDYELLDESVLQRDLARVERYFRGHGYFDAHARAGRILRKDAKHVRVEIQVDAGQPTTNGTIAIAGIDSVPPPVADAARSAATKGLPAKARFDEDAYKATTNAVRRALSDRGYAYVKVEPNVDVDLGAHVADYTFTVTPGPACTFGEVTIVGLDPDGAGPRPQEIPEGPLRRALNITPGTPFSTAEVDSATQALLDMGVLSAVHIVPDLPDPPRPDHVVALRVEVEPARLRELRFGGGAEFDEIKTDFHLLTGWEHKNFLGGLRDFSVEARPGVVLYPIRINNFSGPIHPLPEERFRMQLRQPGFLEARTTGFVAPELNVFPLLVAPNPPNGAPVPGYLEPKAAVGIDRSVSKLFLSFSYNVQVEIPFGYPGTPALIDAPSRIVLSYPQLITNIDLRDDPIHPHAGIFLGNNLQLAGGPFGGSADDVRVQPEVRGYIPLGRHVTFATRASVGFLFPFAGYEEPQLTTGSGKNIKPYVPCGEPGAAEPTCDAAGQAAKQRQIDDIEIVYFRGFYSGGPNTNRGFPLRGIAPFGVVPFLSPSTAAAVLANGCNPNMPAPGCTTIPIAGLSLWELSGELRFQVAGPFSTSLFCDMGDVSPVEFDLRLNRPHLSCGVGARYDTPVGPIRFDVGYRVQPLQVIGYKDETAAAAADPSAGIQPTILGAPIAIAVGIGEAF